MLSSWLILCKNRMWKLVIKKYTSCNKLCNHYLTKYNMFHRENLYHITLHTPEPYGSLRVAHTTSVHAKYTLHHSFKRFSLLTCIYQIHIKYTKTPWFAKPQNTFNENKTTSYQHKSNAQALTLADAF